MKKDDCFPSKYLKATDLDDHEPTVTIDRVVMEELGTDKKPVVYFTGKQKGVVLNGTNWDRIAYLYGDESDDWTGKQITLYTELATFQGRTAPAIRIRKPARSNGNAQQAKQQVITDRGGYKVSETRPAPQPTGEVYDEEIPW